MMWHDVQRILFHLHMIHVCMGLVNALTHGFSGKHGLLEIQMKYKLKILFIQKIQSCFLDNF